MAAPIEIRDARFNANYAETAEGPLVMMTGTISVEDSSTLLNPFFETIHKEVMATGHRLVRVDLRALEFLNSTGFKSFIHWIVLIQQLPKPQRYVVRFKTDRSRWWQSTSMKALACFDATLVQVEN